MARVQRSAGTGTQPDLRRSDGGQIGTGINGDRQQLYCFNVIAPLSIAAFASLI